MAGKKEKTRDLIVDIPYTLFAKNGIYNFEVVRKTKCKTDLF